jgi:hypothetical protein
VDARRCEKGMSLEVFKRLLLSDATAKDVTEKTVR